MLKLLENYRRYSTRGNALAIRDYARKHPMSVCLLNKVEAVLVADAIHRADMGEA